MSNDLELNNQGDLAEMTFEIINEGLSVTRDVWGCKKDGEAITQSPGPVCSPMTGIQTYSINGTFDWYYINEFDFWCTWVYTNPSGQQTRFGVRIHFPFQELGFGTSPYWYVMYDSNPGNEDINWIEVSPKSGAFTWNKDIVGLSITASPIAEKSSITISTFINPY